MSHASLILGRAVGERANTDRRRSARDCRTAAGRFAIGRQRSALRGKHESARHHADHGGRHAVDGDRLADDARIGAVAGAPDLSAEDHHGGTARTVLVRTKRASDDRAGRRAARTRRPTRTRPETRAGGCRLSPTDGDRDRVRGDLLERRRRARSSSNSAYDRLPGRFCASRVGHEHHPLGRVDGQSAQADRVDDGEERGVDADAEAKREDRDERESRAAAQMARRRDAGRGAGPRARRTSAHRGADPSRARRCPSRGARPGAPRPAVMPRR